MCCRLWLPDLLWRHPLLLGALHKLILKSSIDAALQVVTDVALGQISCFQHGLGPHLDGLPFPPDQPCHAPQRLSTHVHSVLSLIQLRLSAQISTSDKHKPAAQARWQLHLLMTFTVKNGCSQATIPSVELVCRLLVPNSRSGVHIVSGSGSTLQECRCGTGNFDVRQYLCHTTTVCSLVLCWSSLHFLPNLL